MSEINVMLVYPVESNSNKENKMLKLNQIELTALMLSQKVGSEGDYFTIGEKIFENLKDGKSITIILEK
jgi:hypothetical protein